MDTKLLIDGIVRQTTILIAQLSTAAGVRAPLSHLADQVFLSLAREIEAQGVGRKVVADMFGLALRTYQKKMQRLTESQSQPERTLWQAAFDVLTEHGSLPRSRLLEMFARDGEKETIGVLTDLVNSGLVYAAGRGPSMIYGVTSASDRQQIREAEALEALSSMAWVHIYRTPGIMQEQLAAALMAPLEEISKATQQLQEEGRVTVAVSGALSAEVFSVPLGATRGWEGAVYDHFQALTTAIAAKLRQVGPRSTVSDLVGGATLSFDLYPGHPEQARVYALLRDVRAEVNQVWNAVRAANEQRPVSDEEKIKVTFYFGQNVDDLEAADKALSGDGEVDSV